jgi:Mg-chelatase subunit ChlD
MTARRDLERRYQQLADVSPEVGSLDPAALEGVIADDPDTGVALLVDLSRTTDPELRARARAVAARLLLPLARRAGEDHTGGSSHLTTTAADDGLDLDTDATLDRLAEHPHLQAGDLRWRDWRRPGRAYVLLVDASGSVTGKPLAAAVVTAAALAGRLQPGDELAVVAFWSRVVVLRHIRSAEPPSTVLDALFDLRGGDTTDVALGLRTALGQAGLARAGRREVLVLTDGMANEGDDPVPVAASAGGAGARVQVLALSDEADARQRCARLADAGGGRVGALAGAAGAPAAVAEVLGGP